MSYLVIWKTSINQKTISKKHKTWLLFCHSDSSIWERCLNHTAFFVSLYEVLKTTCALACEVWSHSCPLQGRKAVICGALWVLDRPRMCNCLQIRKLLLGKRKSVNDFPSPQPFSAYLTSVLVLWKLELLLFTAKLLIGGTVFFLTSFPELHSLFASALTWHLSLQRGLAAFRVTPISSITFNVAQQTHVHLDNSHSVFCSDTSTARLLSSSCGFITPLSQKCVRKPAMSAPLVYLEAFLEWAQFVCCVNRSLCHS